MKHLLSLNERKIDLDKIFMKGRSNPITDASTMKEVKKIFPKAKKTSDVHGAVFYIELDKDLYAKAFSENTFKSEEPFTIEAIYRMKGNKQHFLYQESVNEAKSNILQKWQKPEDILKDMNEYAHLVYGGGNDKKWKQFTDVIRNLENFLAWKDPSKALKGPKMESEVNEAAPKMKKSKEVEELEKLKSLIVNSKKGGAGNRYGREFDKEKNKAVVALDNMISYAKIGI